MGREFSLKRLQRDVRNELRRKWKVVHASAKEVRLTVVQPVAHGDPGFRFFVYGHYGNQGDAIEKVARRVIQS